MSIICNLFGHDAQPVKGSEKLVQLTEYFGSSDNPVRGPFPAIRYKTLCRRCGYEHSGTLDIPSHDAL